MGIVAHSYNKAKGIEPSIIKNVIVTILKNRPNYSIKKYGNNGLTKEVLKVLNINIRKSHRDDFERQIIAIVDILKNENMVIEYKAKNVRYKLADMPEK